MKEGRGIAAASLNEIPQFTHGSKQFIRPGIAAPTGCIIFGKTKYHEKNTCVGMLHFSDNGICQCSGQHDHDRIR